MKHNVTLTHIPINSQWKRCPICGNVHHAATLVQLERLIDQCRTEYIGPMIARQFIRQEDTRGGAAA